MWQISHSSQSFRRQLSGGVELYVDSDVCVFIVCQPVCGILLSPHKDTASYMTPSCVDLARYSRPSSSQECLVCNPTGKASVTHRHTHSQLPWRQPTPLSRGRQRDGPHPKGRMVQIPQLIEKHRGAGQRAEELMSTLTDHPRTHHLF